MTFGTRLTGALLNSEIAKRRSSETGIILYPDFFLAKQEKIHQNYMYLRLLHTAEYLYKHRITITKKSGPGYRVRQIRSWS